MTPESRAHLIKARALALGFSAAGVTDLSPVPHPQALDRWLQGGMAGTMGYMHRQAARRRAPEAIVPGARRAIVVTRNYFAPDPPRPPGSGRIARYARGPDYHVALAEPLDALGAYVRSLGPPETIAQAFCDAGPVPERELAQRAGLGWIGKNTMLIDPHRGSFHFIASILTDLDVAADDPFEADRCGTCRRCLDACPTEAFVEPRLLDSRRCISYLTIEYKGALPQLLLHRFGDWVFGCDICQEVCPWNVKFAAPASDPAFPADADLAGLDLVELANMSDDDFQSRWGATALARAGAAAMRRNAAAILGVRATS